MKLNEFEGKELFQKYEIPVPGGVLVQKPTQKLTIKLPVALKAQVLSGERKKGGGIIFAKNARELKAGLKKLFTSKINGEKVEKVLVEEKISPLKEYYFGFSYDTESRGPVLTLSPNGGSRIGAKPRSGRPKAKLGAGRPGASIVPFDITLGAEPFIIREALSHAKFPSEDFNALVGIIQKLWKLFIDEYALVAEINPLFKVDPALNRPASPGAGRPRAIGQGEFIAGDAKIVLDDEKLNPGERRFIELGGDIAILASGGGASLLNIDALLRFGGRPANYTEYSGNPPAELVKDLTKRVLDRRGIKGCWVIGGTANFTDIYETMRGFIEGLREIKPKPKYPIVIRRGGPRQEEAFLMLREIARREGYNFHLFGSEVSMAESARIMVREAYASRVTSNKKQVTRKKR
ncbi:MAG: ATP citrate lyase citrate-binding domain-containing protein [Candidatus Colwellbacteria bacterium]|nr:ATP citrate lyase citrate-binding domain-containing protein [Candidatus Colwellbacteria bacterium]